LLERVGAASPGAQATVRPTVGSADIGETGAGGDIRRATNFATRVCASVDATDGLIAMAAGSVSDVLNQL
jgi:hypothetical protein